MHNHIRRGLMAASLVAMTFVAACSQNGGAGNIKFITNGTGPQVQNDQLLFLTLRFYENSDSVLYDSKESMRPPILQYLDSVGEPGSLEQSLGYLHAGDSVHLKIKATDFYGGTAPGAPLPPGMDSATELTFEIRVDSVKDRVAFMEDQVALQVARATEYYEGKLADSAVQEQLKTDIEVINAYAAQNGLEGTPTENGVLVVITEEGDGEAVKPGQAVQMNYVGRTLEGKLFDTNIASIAQDEGTYSPQRPYQPFEFQLGTAGVVQGWDEAIATLKVGTKATIILPSPLGYGPQSRGDVIGENEILMFDIEVVSAKQAY